MIKETEGVRDSPRTLGGIMRMLGPGIIMAGGIVGSGELIAATRTGAETGFIFLGLIIFGCVIKCFTQVEMARHAIARNETTLTMLNNVPGPRVCAGRFNGNWIVLFWGITMLIGIGQLGGIVGGVGQAMAITMPLTEKGRAYKQTSQSRPEYEPGRTPDHSIHGLFLVLGSGSADANKSNARQIGHITSPGDQIVVVELIEVRMAAGAGHYRHKFHGRLQETFQTLC